MEQAWAAQGRDAVMAGWRPSAAAGLSSSGSLGSDEPQTAAAAACAAVPESVAESGCTLE